MRSMRAAVATAYVSWLGAASWTDPSKDVVPNPACNASSVRPAIEAPRDVTELHPGHLKYVLTIGDSITAAAFSKGFPVEHRQISWSGGSGGPQSYTMPFLVQQYSAAPLVGPARGLFQWTQVGPCCGKAPWWREDEGYDDQLNAALSGGFSADWRLEVDHLTALVTGRGFGTEGRGGFPMWTQEQQAHYRDSWKVMTIFLGMNDVLTSTDACSDDEGKRDALVSRYREHMVALLDYLVADKDGVFGKMYVNLAMLFGATFLGVQNAKRGWCKMSGHTVWKTEFPCMRDGGDIEAKGAIVDNVTMRVNNVLADLAAAYDRRRPDFGINLVQTLANQQITHQDLRSPLDCFHPTAKAQRLLGTALWNAMLEPSRPTAIDELPTMPRCADERTRLVTYTRAAAAAAAANAVLV